MTDARPNAPRRGRRRRWGIRLLLLLGACTATLLLAEVALRVFDLYAPEARAWPGEFENRVSATFEADATVGWRMRAGLDQVIETEGGPIRVLSDANGRRTGPDRRAPSAAAHTVVLAGDSFVWGMGVEWADTLAGRLEARFDAVRVENLAQPGFGVDQIVLSVEHQGLPLAPALVVVGIYPHDLDRSLTAWRDDLGFEKPTFRLDAGALVPLTPADRPSGLADFVARRSRIAGLWQRAERNLGFRFGVGPWWALNEALLDRLRACTSAAGCRLVLVHVPLHAWRPFDALTDWAARHGVPLVDPVREDPVEPAGIYFEPAGHLNAAGHRYLTELLVRRLEREGVRLGG